MRKGGQTMGSGGSGGGSGGSEVREVVLDGLALLKIVKHCNDCLPSMVAGSLLGIDVNGVVEVTYAYPYPSSKEKKGDRDGEGSAGGGDDADDVQYQIDMMKMLGAVNVENNVVGWYQSMYMGTIYTNEVIEFQHSFQISEELAHAGNSVVIMYDPAQSKKGSLVIKAYRLSDKFLALKRSRSNEFIRPSDIFDELPVRIRSVGHVSAFVRCLKDSHREELDCSFDSLTLSGTEAQTEKHLELMGTWLDDIVNEQQRFQMHAKQSTRFRNEHIRWYAKRKQENHERFQNGQPQLPLKFDESGLKPIPDAPPRLETLLSIGQLDRYCTQLNEHVDSTLNKLLVTSQIGSSSK